ncbi:HAD-like domain-containing protein [Blastocladiella britannica]|nr:HAD-like domain-containing protein [Blastocladiella britannica]
MISAVIFDLGGVCVQSPVHAIAKYEEEIGLPRTFTGVAIGFAGEHGPFQRFERGELEYWAFIDVFQAFLRDPARVAQYRAWITRQNPARAAQLDWTAVSTAAGQIDAHVLFTAMVKTSAKVDMEMLRAIEVLKAAGYRIGCITNDFALPADEEDDEDEGDDEGDHEDDAKDAVSTPNQKEESTADGGARGRQVPRGSAEDLAQVRVLMAQFEVVVASSRVGLRKPDRRIYAALCDRMNVRPDECVFLDDLAVNVRAARKVGMRAIQVKSTRQALDELKTVLEIKSNL